MLDRFEKLILKILQQDGRASTQELSDAVGLSPSPCWRRVKKLEDEGYIRRYAAILDGKKLGLRAFAYVHISLIDHSEASMEALHSFVSSDHMCLNARLSQAISITC